MMRARILLVVVALGAVALTAAPAGHATAGVGVATCRARQWCTVTAAGDSSPLASQFAIGNVTTGTALAVTQDDIKHRQVGGEVLGGNLRGTCAWSQYRYDWVPIILSVQAGCANPVHNTSQFVAANGAAVWTGCYPRCFGGVPISFDRRCGKNGRTFCYGSNCEEYANFFPWTPDSHPANPIRSTHHHRLDVRYLARYGDVWTDSAFYLVKDGQIGHGTADWVFISGAACAVSVGPTGTYHTEPRHE